MLKNIETISANHKKVFLIVEESYKTKEITKYVATVKSIPGAATYGLIHHVKGCMVYFTTDIV